MAGINGLIGSNVAVLARSRGHEVLGKSSAELDFTDRKAVISEFTSTRISTLIVAAAKVGGIWANKSFPVDFLSRNLQIQTNILDAAHQCDIEKVIFLGSSCVYPKNAAQPISETHLLTGSLESTNQAYAIAKIAGIELVNSYREQFGRNWLSVMPCNLYGPGDNFNPKEGHVLASLMHKIHLAKITNCDSVTVWGDGSPLREFLYVEDAAEGILCVAESKIEESILNLGSGVEISVNNLAQLLTEVIGFHGRLVYDPTKPNGTPRKLLDNSKLQRYGWTARTSLKVGLERTYQVYLNSPHRLRGSTE